jgi:hypothetical protein
MGSFSWENLWRIYGKMGRISVFYKFEMSRWFLRGVGNLVPSGMAKI